MANDDAYADAFEKALVMIASLRAALKNNVKHFSLAGLPLTTELEITDALRQDGRVEMDLSERVERTTVAAELAQVRLEFGTVKGTA